MKQADSHEQAQRDDAAEGRPLFSVAILHYEQEEYIRVALDSVFSQTYPNIELVLVDDASGGFDIEVIKEYISTNKGDNISLVKTFVNEKNVGTVKSINRAISASTGEYVLCFAADDALTGDDVVGKYVAAFKRRGSEAVVIAAMAMLCDEMLISENQYFISLRTHKQLNKMTAAEQYEINCSRCSFGMGATCFRRSLFDKTTLFEEYTKYVEDWSFYLRLTRSGTKVHTEPFVALNHRHGGISHNEDLEAPFLRKYTEDVIAIYEKEIIPFIYQFREKRQQKIYESFLAATERYREQGGSYSRKKILKLIKEKANPFWRNRRANIMKRKAGRYITGFACAALASFVIFVLSQLAIVSGILVEGANSLFPINLIPVISDVAAVAIYVCVAGCVISVALRVIIKLMKSRSRVMDDNDYGDAI
jgi:glycosyltransferase involved in cell wall biosynthesis